MQLDDVVSSTSVSIERFQEATDRSIRWLDRCMQAHARPHEQNLFAIIQGVIIEIWVLFFLVLVNLYVPYSM